jgi:hypothetical protein
VRPTATAPSSAFSVARARLVSPYRTWPLVPGIGHFRGCWLLCPYSSRTAYQWPDDCHGAGQFLPSQLNVILAFFKQSSSSLPLVLIEFQWPGLQHGPQVCFSITPLSSVPGRETLTNTVWCLPSSYTCPVMGLLDGTC